MPKLFDFPVTSSTVLRVRLDVSKINTLVVSKADTQWLVTIGIGSTNYVVPFGTQAAADAFVDLWSTRIEDAK